ncbi:ATP-binding protein [Saprospiraceae bacterium]|nr:ATP-binding protein [Saprospiraceae bacterium]
MFLRISIILFFFGFITLSSLISQSLPTSIDHIGSEDGLASQLCQNIIEDDLGNIWISSFTDLQKYDGFNIDVINFENENDKDFAIFNLSKDQNGNIWVFKLNSNETSHVAHLKWRTSIYNFKITIIDPITNKKTSIDDYLQQSEYNGEKIQWLITKENSIVFLTEKLDLFQYTDKLSKLTTLTSLDNFIGVDKDCNLIQFENQKITFTNLHTDKKTSIPREKYDECLSFSISQDGHFYMSFSNEKGVCIKEYKNEIFQNIIQLDKNGTDLFMVYPKNIDRRKNDGKYSLAYESLFIDNKKHSLDLGDYKRELKVYDFVLSKSGILYLATDLGVYVYKLEKRLFKSLRPDAKDLNSVRGLYVSEDLVLYTGPDQEKIMSPNSKYNLSFLDNVKMDNIITTYYRDPLNMDQVWSCGHVAKGTRLIDFKKQTIEYGFLEAVSTNAFFRSSYTNKMYVLTYGGILQLDSLTNKFKHIISQGDSLNNKYRTGMNQYIERDNSIWIASDIGVIVYHEKDKSFYLDTIFSNSLKHKVQYIHQDKIEKDIVWLATSRAGLKKWNTRLNTFKTYDTNTGLSNNNTHAVIEDSQERLWIPTNRNLNCIDKKTDKNYIFTAGDGLNNSEFNRNSFFQDTTTHNIYFGGLSGYNYFNPDSINTSGQSNNIHTRIISANIVKDDSSIEDIYASTISDNHIEMYEEDVSIDLDLSTTHLVKNRMIKFSYRIPQLSDEWKEISSNNLKINRLPYGSYSLEIIADRNRPSFTSDVLSIDLEIIRPFKKTLIYYILCFLIFTAVMWFLVNLYLKRIKERNKILEETVTLRTSELTESNETKNKLFAILAHDLRNPIASLTDISEKIKFLAKNNRLGEIDILAEQTKGKINALSDNLNNILIWALSENKLLEQKPEKYSLKLEIKKILDLYSTSIVEKNIQTKYQLEVVDQVFMDIAVIQTILRNVISNAIKFSYIGGTIEFAKTSETKDRMILTIKDNGIGMVKEKGKIQKEEDKIRDLGRGSGVGLKIIKEIASQADVTITITSHPTQGTSVNIDMPKN